MNALALIPHDTVIMAFIFITAMFACIIEDEVMLISVFTCIAPIRASYNLYSVDETTQTIAKYTWALHLLGLYIIATGPLTGKDVAFAAHFLVAFFVNITLAVIETYTPYPNHVDTAVVIVIFILACVLSYAERTSKCRWAMKVRLDNSKNALRIAQEDFFRNFYDMGIDSVDAEELVNDLIPADAVIVLEREFYKEDLLASRILGYDQMSMERDIEAAVKAAPDSSAKCNEL